jgi:hypothetical protein
MNLAELHRKLIAVARANPPADRVPYAFGKRITALLAAQPVLDRWALWSGALWRGAMGCLALALLLSAWSWFDPSNHGTPNDLSQAFEKTLLAAVDQDTNYTW